MLESRQRQFDGLRVQTWEGGPEGDPKTGQGFPVLMLHGVGPGTSIQGNFGPVLAPLAASCRIVGMDLMGFGGSQGKPTPPAFDVELWLRQAEAMA